MSRLTVVLAAPAVLAFSWLALAQEAADTFNLLYGNDLKRVAATKDTADDLALAQQLLEAAKTPKTDPALAALLCEKAYELALKDPKGAPVAVQAMELAAAKVAAKKGECLEKIVAVRQQQYAAARGDAKTKAAEDLLLALDTAAEAKADAGDPDAAVALYRRALVVAVTPDAKNRIRAKIAELAGRQKIARQVADLKAKVEANPSDAASRNELVRLCVVELDNPAEAAKFLSDTVDEAPRKYLPAAVKPVAEAPELACLELGDWYMTLSDNASVSAKPAMLARAAGYYKRFLELHKAEDVSATKATLGLKKAEAALAKLGKTAPGTDSAAGGWLNLLRLVDPAKDFLSGKWDVQDDGLHVAATPGSHCAVIPVVPEGAYELRVKFTRNVGQNTVFVVLRVGPSSIAMRLDRGGARLADLHNKQGGGNASSGTPDLNRPYTLQFKVCPDERDSTIDVKLDGKPYLSWRGSWADLSLYPEEGPIGKSLGVGTQFADVTFQTVELRMITGKATLLRPATPPKPTKPGPTKPGPTRK
jgi:hypothetical protein